MALMGPQGFKEVGETCIARSHYAAKQLGELPGVEIKLSPSFFKEFVVDFDGTGKSVAEVNEALLEPAASSAARTSPPSSPSSARARSTASPSTTTRPTSTRWSSAVAEVTR